MSKVEDEVLDNENNLVEFRLPFVFTEKTYKEKHKVIRDLYEYVKIIETQEHLLRMNEFVKMHENEINSITLRISLEDYEPQNLNNICTIIEGNVYYRANLLINSKKDNKNYDSDEITDRDLNEIVLELHDKDLDVLTTNVYSFLYTVLDGKSMDLKFDGKNMSDIVRRVFDESFETFYQKEELKEILSDNKKKKRVKV